MFSQILTRGQFAILILLLAAVPAAGQELEDEDGFISVGDYPWVGYVGPLSDGLHGLRFGMGGFEVNRIMREKGLEPANARPHTLRFEGSVLGHPAELITEFTRERAIDPLAELRVVQIRWNFQGLPQQGFSFFEKLDEMLATRYGKPVLKKDEGMQNLDSGDGRLQRLYYGPQAQAWLEYSAIRRQEYALMIRIECPQLPKPDTQ
jgi:hypothetical protein